MLVAFVLIFQWEKEFGDAKKQEEVKKKGNAKKQEEVKKKADAKKQEEVKKKGDAKDNSREDAKGKGNDVVSDNRKLLVVRYVLLFIGMVVLCYRPSTELKITAVDVGQGDGIVIESKGTHIMIDGGSTSKKDVAKYQLVPFLSYEGIGRLDAVILTHEDEDHMSGILEMMELMEERRSNIRIRNLILPDIDDGSKGDNYRMLEAKAAGLEIPTSYVKQGDELNLDSACHRIKCIGPVSKMVTDEPNAYSTILLLKCGDFSGLFTGDVEGTGQDNLKDYIRSNPDEFKNLTLLKVAHHGSGYTTDEEFLELTRPQISLISCGVDNRYGHPHKELVERLEKIGTRIYRTDESGAITLELRHSKLIVDTFIEDMHVNDE
jgi:competence protein ComEC